VLGRDDFFVSPANAIAVATIDTWPDWPDHRLILTGPKGSGKTHLAHVWAARASARIISARDLSSDVIPDLICDPIVIEDVPRIAKDAAAQEALFHLFNLAAAHRQSLLLTGRDAPTHWALSLPDLQSRVASVHNVAMSAPDDRLLSAVLAKLFADRQVMPKPDLIPYLISRIDRSFEAAAQVVAQLDKAALDRGVNLTRALASRILAPDSHETEADTSPARED